MKSKRIAIINLIVAVIVFAFTLGQAFAWFFGDRKTDGQDFNGSSAQAYFAGGNGTEQDPYEINDKYHLYNLAWLQNTGKLTRSDGGKYYFELTSNVSLPTDFWLPPIGTEENPFSSDFNGNGYTLTNLKITTDSSKLTGVSNGNSVAFSNAVGMFGKTAEGSEIHNFILQSPVVEVANANATYQSGTNRVAGLAVGHVALDSKVYSVGVLANSSDTELWVSRAGYSTFNSIIGELAEGADSSVTGGGHVGGEGSGSSFGATLDVQSMYSRMAKIDANDGASWRLPSIETGNENLTLGSMEKLPFTVVSDNSTATDKSSYTGATAKEVVASNNIGYLLGNQNKVYSKTRSFGDKLVENSYGNWTFADGSTPASESTIPLWLYRMTAQNLAGDTYSSGSGFSALTEAEYEALPENIKNLMSGYAENGEIESVRIQQQYQNVGAQVYAGSDSNSQWSPHGQISWNGKTYGEGFRKGGYKDPVVNEDGIYLTATGNLLDDTYYEATKKYYEYALVDGVKNYLVAEEHEGWTDTIYGVTSDGYALNQDGVCYDVNGWLIDENGYAYNEEGYIVSNNWPLGDTYIGDDGYLKVLTDGVETDYTDNSGNNVYAYGYDIDASGNLLKDGVAVGIDMGGWTQGLTARAGTYLKVKQGYTCEYYRYENGVPLPNNGIWFKPAQAGTIRLIIYSESGGDGFALLKGKRTNATADNPFYVDYTQAGADIEAEEVMKFNLPSYVLFYFEYEVTAEDIADGRIEYWLAKYGSGGAYFVYMDLGASADADSSTIDRNKAVSAVDFIYDGVSIAQTDDTAETPTYSTGDFIVRASGVLYEATGTSIYFDNLNTVLKIAYLRKSAGGEQTLSVTVTGTTDNSTVLATKADKVEFTFSET